MWKIVALVILGATGRVPMPSIASFVGPETLIVVRVDLTRISTETLPAPLTESLPFRLVGDRIGSLPDWSRRLQAAGVRELVLIADLNGPPVVVVPGVADRDHDRVGRLLCGKEGGASPIAWPSYAVIRGAVVAGSNDSLDRVRALKPAARPDLMQALDGEEAGVRVAISATPEVRRVLEELVPNFPRELGGGPITEWTRGVRWISIELAGGKAPWRVVVAASDPDAAKKLAARGPALAGFLAKAPIDREMPRLLGLLETSVQGDRLQIQADAEVAAGLIDAATRPVVDAIAQSDCTMNEKQIALAIHNYASATGRKYLFPPAYSTDRAGKPLLSWRVLILPYLDQQQELYREFHLDEPWDSPHNRALIGRMPAVYRCPLESSADAREGKTRYVAPRSPGTIFRGAQSVSIKEITDGTSNTIFFLDAGEAHAVTWTKPDDWDVPPEGVADLFHAHPGGRDPGTCAAMADCSVRFLRARTPAKTLRALFTFAGNEVISFD